MSDDKPTITGSLNIVGDPQNMGLPFSALRATDETQIIQPVSVQLNKPQRTAAKVAAEANGQTVREWCLAAILEKLDGPTT